MAMRPAPKACGGRSALGRDGAVQEEVRNVARNLVNTVRLMREDWYRQPDKNLTSPRPK